MPGQLHTVRGRLYWLWHHWLLRRYSRGIYGESNSVRACCVYSAYIGAKHNALGVSRSWPHVDRWLQFGSQFPRRQALRHMMATTIPFSLRAGPRSRSDTHFRKV